MKYKSFCNIANTETFSRNENSDGTQNTADNSGTSENSDNTVIFMHQRQGSESSKRNTLPTPTSPGNLLYIILKYCN